MFVQNSRDAVSNTKADVSMQLKGKGVKVNKVEHVRANKT